MRCGTWIVGRATGRDTNIKQCLHRAASQPEIIANRGANRVSGACVRAACRADRREHRGRVTGFKTMSVVGGSQLWARVNSPPWLVDGLAQAAFHSSSSFGRSSRPCHRDLDGYRTGLHHAPHSICRPHYCLWRACRATTSCPRARGQRYSSSGSECRAAMHLRQQAVSRRSRQSRADRDVAGPRRLRRRRTPPRSPHSARGCVGSPEWRMRGQHSLRGAASRAARVPRADLRNAPIAVWRSR